MERSPPTPLLKWQAPAPSAEPLVFLYNRVGRAGSESMRNFLRQLCYSKDLWTPPQWPAWSRSTRTREKWLWEAVKRMRRVNDTVKPCRVLVAHFRWTPLRRMDGIAYINMLRDPVARWRSAHDLYVRKGWGVRKADVCGGWTAINATACLLANTSARTCLSACDAAQCDYFMTPEETRVCEPRLLFERYAFVVLLEHLASDVSKLVRLLTGRDTITSQASFAANATAAALPDKRHITRRNIRHVGGALAGPAEQVLRRDLACDARLYEAVSRANGHARGG
jgi:hypothetical protein